MVMRKTLLLLLQESETGLIPLSLTPLSILRRY